MKFRSTIEGEIRDLNALRGHGGGDEMESGISDFGGSGGGGGSRGGKDIAVFVTRGRALAQCLRFCGHRGRHAVHDLVSIFWEVSHHPRT